MKYLFLLILICISACSSGQARRDKVNELNLGQIIYQKNQHVTGIDDLIITQDKDIIRVISIDSCTRIRSIDLAILNPISKSPEITEFDSSSNVSPHFSEGL